MSVVFFISLVIVSVGWVQGGMLSPLDLVHLPHFPVWFNGIVGLACLAWFMKD